jgi:hypothetical protein
MPVKPAYDWVATHVGDLWALEPLQVDGVGEGDGSIVVRYGAGGGGALGGQGDTVVDVQDAVCSARREDVGSGWHGVGLGVDLARSPDTASCDHRGRCCSGRGILREVVGGQEGPGNAGIKLGIAVVGGIDNSKVEAAGVLQAQVDLALLSVVGDSGSWSDVGLEAVESKRHNLCFHHD